MSADSAVCKGFSGMGSAGSVLARIGWPFLKRGQEGDKVTHTPSCYISQEPHGNSGQSLPAPGGSSEELETAQKRVGLILFSRLGVSQEQPGIYSIDSELTQA